MPRLGIEIDNKDIKKTTSNFEKMDDSIKKVGGSVDKVGTKSQSLGVTMAKSFSVFLLGGAVQKGFSKLLSDIDESNRKAKVLTDSLRTLRFLGNEEEVAESKRLRKPLARFGVRPGEIGDVSANIKSIAGDLPLASRSQIQLEAGAAEGGGVGNFGQFSEAVTLSAIQRKEFQTPEGITGISNALTQGQVEARLLKKDSGKQSLAIVTGLSAGLSVPESLSAFAILTKITGSPDAAIEKLKIVLNLWVKTGAKASGASFIGYITATAGKTDAELNPEELTASTTIRPFGTSDNTKVFTAQKNRIAAAQKNPASLAKAAFQKQLDDPRTRAAIIEDEKNALQEGAVPGDKDLITAQAAEAQVSVIGSAIWASILDAIIGGQGDTDTELGPIGDIIRGQFRQTISEAEPVSAQRDELKATLQSINANAQVKQKTGGSN